MKTIEIVAAYLKENGFDGLVYPDIDCGCCLGDLQPCGETFAECMPAYKHELKPGDARGDFLMSESQDPEDAGVYADEEVV